MEMENPRMDCGIAVKLETRQAATVRFYDVRKGDLIVVGHRGVRVLPFERSPSRSVFEFMSSMVSSEKPKSATIGEIAKELMRVKAQGERILLVLGPVVVHTGAARHIVRMIESGYADKLFAGNGLAVHDIEQAWFGTSLGVNVTRGAPVEGGHENHMRVINTLRQMGGIRAAVEAGLITSGIMYACLKHGVDFVLAGSIRDDGPLPEVVTDVIEAQKEMARRVADVGLVLAIGSTLHAVATGNLLPARVKMVCVDINPAVVTKLADRGSFQTIGLVSDAEPFLRELVEHLAGKISA